MSIFAVELISGEPHLFDADFSTDTEPFNCDETLAVGQWVRLHPTLPKHVVGVSTNVYDSILIGKCVKKMSATKASIMRSGTLRGLTGLAQGQVVYLNTSGVETTDVPTTGHLQVLGFSYSTNEMVVRPAFAKTILGS